MMRKLFTLGGRIVAVLAVLLGAYAVLVGSWVAGMESPSRELALARYLPGRPTTGAAIDRGIYYLLLGIAFGIVTEISYAISRILKAIEDQRK